MATARHAKRRRRIRAACQSHRFGPGTSAGGGIVRFVCADCGSVSIDLTAADTPTRTGSLFEPAPVTLTRP